MRGSRTIVAAISIVLSVESAGHISLLQEVQDIRMAPHIVIARNKLYSASDEAILSLMRVRN